MNNAGPVDRLPFAVSRSDLRTAQVILGPLFPKYRQILEDAVVEGLPIAASAKTVFALYEPSAGLAPIISFQGGKLMDPNAARVFGQDVVYTTSAGRRLAQAVTQNGTVVATGEINSHYLGTHETAYGNPHVFMLQPATLMRVPLRDVVQYGAVADWSTLFANTVLHSEMRRQVTSSQRTELRLER